MRHPPIADFRFSEVRPGSACRRSGAIGCRFSAALPIVSFDYQVAAAAAFLDRLQPRCRTTATWQRCPQTFSPSAEFGRAFRRATIFITSDAVEFLSQSAPATVLRNHPGTFHVWRIMAHVLIMAAFQLRHPVTFFIQMKSSDLSLHCRRIAPSQMVLWLILAAVIKRRLRTAPIV